MSFQAVKWTTRYINDLPDDAFALIEPGGEKDEEGKTVPRTLRHLPHHKPNGDIDLPHLRNAMARVTHIKTVNMPKSEAIQKAHNHLLRHYKELGMTHPPCSVPGCKGYYPEEKKSMLEDWQSFAAWRREYLQRKGYVFTV
ncbi:MAG: hypothetical protein QXN95_05180 [Candidatus Bathyarchaeia archaeon]